VSFFACSPLFLSPHFQRVLHSAEAVRPMPEGTPGVTQGHSRSGKTHDFPDLLPLLLFVAVYGAKCAGRFLVAVRAFLKPLGSVAQKVIAAGAGFTFIRGMVVSAIDLRHALKSCVFLFQSAGESCHI